MSGEGTLSEEKKSQILKAAEELKIDTSNLLLQEQLFKGYQVELEHGTKLKDPRANVTFDDMKTTLRIAWAHLLEIPDYYDWLDDMEERAKKAWENLTNKEGQRDAKLELLRHVEKHHTDGGECKVKSKIRARSSFADDL